MTRSYYHSPRVRIVTDGCCYSVQVGDPDWIEATVEIIKASSIEDAFAQIDRRKEIGQWPFTARQDTP